jgi:deoxyribonuclease V
MEIYRNRYATGPRWDLEPAEAIALQRRLSCSVIKKSTLKAVNTVAGVDTAYRQNIARAAVVMMTYPALETMDEATAERGINYPYIPGLLTFREGPAVLAALSRLEILPDLLMFDGQGIAHPRRCGIASHIGVLMDVPSIGCAKTKLVGQYDEPALHRGAFTLLNHKGQTIGAVVRTRTNVAPVFVSTGHRVSLRDSIRFVLDCCRGYRLPETIRRADHLAAFRDK